MSTTETMGRRIFSEIGRFLAFARGFSENYLTLLIAAIAMAWVRTTMHPSNELLQITAAAGWSIAVMLFWLLVNFTTRFYCSRCRELTDDDSEFPGLLSRIRELAEDSGVTLRRVAITSPKPLEETGFRFVSLAKGMPPTGEIAIADALLRVLPEDERLAVAAHELGHLSRRWPLYNPLYYPAVGAFMGVVFAAHPASVVWPAVVGVGLYVLARGVNSPKRPWIQMMLAEEHKLADQAAMQFGIRPEQMLKANFRKAAALFGDSSALKIIMDWSSTPHGRYLLAYLAEFGDLSDDQVYDLAKDVIREESGKQAWAGSPASEEAATQIQAASEQ